MTSRVDIDRLADLPLSELRLVWAERLGGRAPKASARKPLLRELAWRLQARESGGLDAKTSRLLNTAVRRAMSAGSRTAGQHRQGDERTLDQKSRTPKPRASVPTPAPGSRLVRIWRERAHEVTVLAGGRFRYEGVDYDSLSEVARAITGTRWSGPRFFGLTGRGGCS